MKRLVLDRIFMAGIALLVVTVAQLEPESLSYVLMRIGGLPARLCIGLLLGLSIIALLDVIVNDVMPQRFKFKTAMRMRQGLWLCIAINFAGLAFVTLKYGNGLWISIFYLWYAFFAAVISYMDLYYEYRETVNKMRELAGKTGQTVPGALADE